MKPFCNWVGAYVAAREVPLNANDHDLGMPRKITRRDFVNGVSVATVGALTLPLWAQAQFAPEQSPDYYPPARTGMHLTKVPNAPGKPRQEQHRLGQAELLATTFETVERKLRDQLGKCLGAGGFDPARDIVAITVNRWPHGYAYTYNSLFEPMEWVYTNSENRPNVIAWQPYGLISIANSDAGASPHTDITIWEAWRAVGDILNRRSMPFLA